MNTSEASLRGRYAAHLRWAHCPDRTAETEPARRGLEAKFEREIDELFPGLSGVERAKRIRNLKSAHYAALALKRHRK